MHEPIFPRTVFQAVEVCLVDSPRAQSAKFCDEPLVSVWGITDRRVKLSKLGDCLKHQFGAVTARSRRAGIEPLFVVMLCARSPVFNL
jgi:hypothetical protein